MALLADLRVFGAFEIMLGELDGAAGRRRSVAPHAFGGDDDASREGAARFTLGGFVDAKVDARDVVKRYERDLEATVRAQLGSTPYFVPGAEGRLDVARQRDADGAVRSRLGRGLVVATTEQ